MTPCGKIIQVAVLDVGKLICLFDNGELWQFDLRFKCGWTRLHPSA